jgi:small GTP-binding protein
MEQLLAKKICLIGDFGVGKTSLVRRYVSQSFSTEPSTTVGIKIDCKEIELVPGERLKLVIWDIAGSEELNALSSSYLRGASGYLLVADGCRRSTLGSAQRLGAANAEVLGPTPRLCLVNKTDMEDQWEVSSEDIRSMRAAGWKVVKTSAKTGTNVGLAFIRLSEMLVRP